jgi:hypothetical protein
VVVSWVLLVLNSILGSITSNSILSYDKSSENAPTLYHVIFIVKEKKADLFP